MPAQWGKKERISCVLLLHRKLPKRTAENCSYTKILCEWESKFRDKYRLFDVEIANFLGSTITYIWFGVTIKCNVVHEQVAWKGETGRRTDSETKRLLEQRLVEIDECVFTHCATCVDHDHNIL
jgi:hypothetical protein